MDGKQIEQQIRDFLIKAEAGSVPITEEAINRFAERCKRAIRKQFTEKKDKSFRLRMSNIGQPLRQLWLQKTYGQGVKSPEFKLLVTYGDMIEALMLLILESIPEINITATDKPVSLNVDGTEVKGTLDLTIDGEVVDIKSASPYSYDSKFDSYGTLGDSDDFGYIGQLFGYSLADKRLPKGWLVVNKSNGQFKFVSIPSSYQVHDGKGIIASFKEKLTALHTGKGIPKCTGVVDEMWYKKATGRKMLGGACRFCEHKDKCHKKLYSVQDKCSKAKTSGIKHYTKLLATDEEMKGEKTESNMLEGIFS